MKKPVRKFAYVACNGGTHNHSCQYGCIGCGACVEACRKNAVSLNAKGVAEIDRIHCVGCRLCEKACPQHIIHMHQVGESFLVLCSNQDKGVEAKEACDVSCIGCGLCAKNCPVSAIEIRNKKPVWVKDRCVMCLSCLHHCPKFAIQYENRTKKHGQYTNPNVK